ncbi:hypothetical protein [Salegentibacter mishustinae]|uniref:hypothetical protein n=1 Tax=Salegentibacter mishustinae TaxID=270918 RepID=UPI0024924F8C|nr:hypothetical protein [Salegentibacter mishustinae]
MKQISKIIQISIFLLLISCTQNKKEYTMIIEKKGTIISAEYRVEIERLPDSANIFFSKQAYLTSDEFINDSIPLSLNRNVVKYADFIVYNRDVIEKEKEKLSHITIMDGTIYKFYILKPGEKTDTLFIDTPSESRFNNIGNLIRALNSSYQKNFDESLGQINFK